jgi:signal peptidase I
MEPTIEVNSINIIKVCDISEVEVGDIICFNYGSDIVHRVIEVVTDEQGNILLHTQGDSNKYADSIEITDDMFIGKVTKTFNNAAKFIDKYSIEPGNIDGTSLAKDIMIKGIIIGLVIFFVSWLFGAIRTAISSLFKKDDFNECIDKYINDIDELMIYRDFLYKIKNRQEDDNDSTYSLLGKRIARTKAIMEMKELHYHIKEFKKSIDNCYYIKRLGNKIDEQISEENVITISQILKELGEKLPATEEDETDNDQVEEETSESENENEEQNNS